MKKQFLFWGAILFAGSTSAQQAPTNTAPAGAGPSGQNSQQFWSRAGNSNFPGTNTNNIFGSLWNSPIYTVTNGVNRTVLMGLQPPGSITGAFGLGTNFVSPLAKLHISDFGTNATYDAQGRMFRTDGLVSVQNNWSIWTGNTPATATQKFRISTMANSGAVEMGTVQSGLLHLITNNQRRITILGNSVLPFNRTGFVGFNNQAPLFHHDVNTQNPNAGGNLCTFDIRKLINLIA